MRYPVAEPKIAGTKSIKLDMKPGKYWFCTCGESSNQPFCDGSHWNTDFKPLEFEITEEKTYAFCPCKKSSKQPFCDGSHKKLT